MERHESGCTANPNRICKMCVMAGLEQKSMEQLDAAIASVAVEPENYEEQKGQYDALREATQGCPACTLALIRQTKHVIYFCMDWAAESKQWISTHCRRSEDGVMP